MIKKLFNFFFFILSYLLNKCLRIRKSNLNSKGYDENDKYRLKPEYLDDYVAQQSPTSPPPEEKRLLQCFSYFLLFLSLLLWFLGILILLDAFTEPLMSCFDKAKKFQSVEIVNIQKQPTPLSFGELVTVYERGKIISDSTDIHSQSHTVHKSVWEFIISEGGESHTVKLIEIADKIMIALTFVLVGVVLAVKRNDLFNHEYSLETFMISFKKIDMSILSMVVISLSVHFLSEILDKEHNLSYSNAFGTGFVIISIVAYAYITHYHRPSSGN